MNKLQSLCEALRTLLKCNNELLLGINIESQDILTGIQTSKTFNYIAVAIYSIGGKYILTNPLP